MRELNNENNLDSDIILMLNELKNNYDIQTLKDIFNNKINKIEDISGVKPNTPSKGQLWINENNILLYYDGNAWRDVKALCTNYNFDYMEDFLKINTFTPSISNDKETTYLLPDIKKDKIFINSFLDTNYKEINDITIQYNNIINGNYPISLCHVNPRRLANIKRILIKPNINNKIINLSSFNTEFYGIKNGYGNLLHTNSTLYCDYYDHNGYIVLSDDIIQKYDFILAVIYEFENNNYPGVLDRKTDMPFVNNEPSIYINDNNDLNKISVFAGPITLNNNSFDYNYNTNFQFKNNYIIFDNKIINNTNIVVTKIGYKEEGRINKKDTGEFYINTKNIFTKPLVIVKGVALYSDGFKYEKINNTITILDNTIDYLNVEYSVIETSESFVEENIVTNENETINLSSPINNDEIPIIFINGIFVSNNDITINSNSILVNNLKKDMKYILLKLKKDNVIYNGTITDVTIPLNKVDDAMVFISGQLLLSEGHFVIGTDLKTIQKPIDGQIIKHYSANGSKLYNYNNKQWIEIIDNDTINAFKYINSYVLNDNSINIINLTIDSNKKLNIYGYTFTNHIDGDIKEGLGNIINCSIPIQYNHKYEIGNNNISLWINGLRQNNYNEYNDKLNLKEYLDNDHYFHYVIEDSNNVILNRIILDSNNKVKNTKNIFETNMPIAEGYVRLFIGGIRQPSTVYTILDNFHIKIHGELLNNFPKVSETIISNNNIYNYDYEYEQDDYIFLEVRKDLNWKEFICPVRYKGQVVYNEKDNIPDYLFKTKDKVNLYINGLLFPYDFTIDKLTKNIILPIWLKDVLGKDYIEEYFIELKDKYGSNFNILSKSLTVYDIEILKWRKENGYDNSVAEYVPKKNIDTLLFEWR